MQLTPKHKKFFKSFPKKEAEVMKKFADQEKIKVNNENNMIRLIEFLADQG